MIPVSVTSSDSEKIIHRFGLFRGSSGATKFGLKKSKFWIGYFVRLGTGCDVDFYHQFYFCFSTLYKKKKCRKGSTARYLSS